MKHDIQLIAFWSLVVEARRHENLTHNKETQ